MGVQATGFGKVAVLLGGNSAEREVSLVSGGAVLDALRRRGVDAHPVDLPQQELAAALLAGGYDRVFIVLHGRGGEDGQVQGLLESLGLPYTGSGVMGSAIGMDKYRCKLLWHGLGLPTPEFRVVESEEQLAGVAEIGFPVMVKPIHEGSSIGITRADDMGQLRAAWADARKYDHEVLVERWVRGREYTAAVLRDEALPLIRLEVTTGFYDYHAKYHSDETRYHCPCGLDTEQEAELQRLVLRAFRAVGARDWGRVDLFVDEAGAPWLIEINTVPGMTSHSLVPMAAKARGIGFDELVWRILGGTLGRS